MTRLIDLTGRIFGRLTGLWLPDGKDFSSDSSMWVVQRTDDPKFESVVWPPGEGKPMEVREFTTLEEASEYCFAQYIALKLEGN